MKCPHFFVLAFVAAIACKSPSTEQHRGLKIFSYDEKTMATALVESIALPENPPQEAFTLTAGQRQLLANDRNVRVEVAFYRDGRAVAPDSGKPMSPRNTACVFDNDKDVLLLGSEAALRALNNAVALFIIFAGQCEIGDHGVVTRMTNRFGGRAILQSDATRNAKLLATTHARASPSAY